MTCHRRDLLRAVGAAGAAGTLAGCTGGSGQPGTTDGTAEAPTTTAEPTTAATSGSDDPGEGPTVEVSDHPEHGEILVDADGMTLYLFTPDEDGESTCYDSCAEAWPPLTVDGDPVPPEGGLPMDLGTTERDDGTTQVVYDGWPLYYYVSDAEPGDVTGHGVNDVWFVVHPEGNDRPGEAGTTAGAATGNGGGDTTTDDGGGIDY